MFEYTNRAIGIIVICGVFIAMISTAFHPPYYIGIPLSLGFFLCLVVIGCEGEVFGTTSYDWEIQNQLAFFARIGLFVCFIGGIYHWTDTTRPEKEWDVDISNEWNHMIRPDKSWNVDFIPYYDEMEKRWFTRRHGFISQEDKEWLDTLHDIYLEEKALLVEKGLLVE